MRFSDSGWLTVNSSSGMEVRGIVGKGFLATATMLEDLRDENKIKAYITLNGKNYPPGAHAGKNKREDLRDIIDMHLTELKEFHRSKHEAANARET